MQKNKNKFEIDLLANDKKILAKAVKTLRQGVAPRIAFPQGFELSSRHITTLADIANCAADRELQPVLIDVSDASSLQLEIAGLLPHFEVLALPHRAIKQYTQVVEIGWIKTWFVRLFFGAAVVGLAIGLAGCSSSSLSRSYTSDDVRIEPTADVPGQVQTPARFVNRCADFPTGQSVSAVDLMTLQQSTHGPGDVVRVDISDGEDFSGTFVVNLDGTIILPYAGRVAALGKTSEQVTAAVKAKLIAGGFFRSGQVQVAVLPLRWAPINISISGAVFNAGRAIINDLASDKRDPDALTTIGDAPITRYIDSGLRAGAGIRPDADLSQVHLIRGDISYTLDLTGLVTGVGTPEIPLMAGDLLEVPSSDCFHPELMRPSQATPPGIRVFMSNLTVPATGNNPSAIDSYATNLPYGAKLLQAATSSNCIGGARATNAHRTVVMISNNPLTGRSEVIERTVEELIRNVNREDINPYMLPNDAIACYDSGITNLREVARTISEVFSPFGLVFGLL